MSSRHRIYDRCQYINCKNGRHNNYHLFRFPSKLERQKIWVENAGNDAIKHWTPSSLMCAGICRDHFREHIDYFQAKRLRLRVNRNPIHWKEAERMKKEKEELEAKKAAELLAEKNAEMVAQKKGDLITKVENDNHDTPIIPAVDNQMVAQEIIIYTTAEASDNFHDLKGLQIKSEIERQIEEERVKYQQMEEVDPNLIPKRENINICIQPVGGTDPHTIPKDKIPIVQQLNYDNTNKKKVKQYVNINKVNINKKKMSNIEEQIVNMSNRSNVVLNSEVNVINNKILISKTPVKTAPTISIVKQEKKEKEETEEQNDCTINCKILTCSLKNSNKLLKRKVQQLQIDLKTEKKKNYRLRKRLEKENAKKKFSIDDYLDRKEIEPAAKTMIKLQLHTTKAHYSVDEKDLTKEMYFYSPSYYTKLRAMGLNLPSESTARAWSAQSNDIVVSD